MRLTTPSLASTASLRQVELRHRREGACSAAILGITLNGARLHADGNQILFTDVSPASSFVAVSRQTERLLSAAIASKPARRTNRGDKNDYPWHSAAFPTSLPLPYTTLRATREATVRKLAARAAADMMNKKPKREAAYRGFKIKMERRDLCWVVKLLPTRPRLPFLSSSSFRTFTQSERAAMNQARKRVDLSWQH
jgi:hypothetical protein